MHNNNAIIKTKIIAASVKTLIVILILSLILISPTAKNHLSAQTLDEQLQSIKDEKAANQKKIDDANKKEQEYLKQVKEVDSQMLSSLSDLNDLNKQLAQVKANIDKIATDLVAKDQDLNQINNELSQKTAILNQRVAVIYKNNSGSVLEFLFKAEDYIDFISRLRLLNLIANQDAEIVKEVKDKKDANLNIKQAMLNLEEKQKQDKDDIEKLISQSKQKEAEIENIYNQKKDLLSGATANKNALVAMEKQLESEEATITKTLEGYTSGNAPEGKFMWPDVAPIMSPFGVRFDPFLRAVRLHTGIDIGAHRGDPVKAAAAGQVIQASYTGDGYGNCIIIYHGGEISTLYGHLQGFNCSIGENVAMGQVIGFVGSTGFATGPHLHFEVRINGVPQNPIQYLQ